MVVDASNSHRSRTPKCCTSSRHQPAICWTLKPPKASPTTSRCRSWGTERLSESGYFRGKFAQEKLIQESSIPYSIVHATQFFEFIKSIADAAADGNTVRLSPS